MINPVSVSLLPLQVPGIIGFADIAVVFFFAFTIVGGSVYFILAMNRERWFNIRRIPFKKLVIDVPGNTIVKIVPKAGSMVELKILGKKRTYFLPDNASRDGIVYHLDFDNSNPKITPERRKWKAPNEKDIKDKKLPVFRDYYNSEEISKLISNKSFGMYQRAKVAVNVNNIIVILIVVAIGTSGFGVFLMNQFIEEFPDTLARALEPLLNGGE